MRRRMLAALALAAALASGARAAGAGLEVTVTGVRSAEGQVILRVWGEGSAFPTDPDAALAVVRAPISEGTARATFPDLPPGAYAVAAAHDENGNGRLDMTALGPPAEGYGFSNDAMGFLGPPGFAAARIELGGEPSAIVIRLRY